MQLRLEDGSAVFKLKLHDNSAARDFAKLLPLAVELRDYASTELIADLPRALDCSDAPTSHRPRAGDITYYRPWGNLALFYRDAPAAAGLVPLGRFTGGAFTLRADRPQSVVFEPIEDDVTP
ncbi:cyclophilin-like fold protein [Actomonas aquatica]|uniref:Cyclophilin-like fold protein n=1 Tax=Actomonas aquatica TaxID=2866162 RepID=A0ABZ1C3H4_9BACT|nr:cyclophilin-like fold protein [Opitutus sp. WL0086]WRQ85996.1 cyclophilin-like fold protein [Opitutus sp. WL0086]